MTDYNLIRKTCAERAAAKMERLSLLDKAAGIISDESQTTLTVMDAPGRRPLSYDIEALARMATLLRDAIAADIWFDIEQFSSLMVRDVIEPMLRDKASNIVRDRLEPIQWLTGNSYFPAWRSFDEIEMLWQVCEEPDYLQALIEKIERKCDEIGIFIGYPENDNSIYAVDTRVWEWCGDEDGEAENLSDDWSRKEQSAA